MVKISVLGDIMCEGPFLNAARRKNGEYDFDTAFSEIRSYLSNSDYVIGNLETPITEKNDHITKQEDMYSFNTPAQFAAAVKKMGVDLVLTANNHCFDRGLDGLKETLHILDKIELRHTGTYEAESDAEAAIFEVDGVKIAVISCTASTNAEITKCCPDIHNVNLLDKQVIAVPKRSKIQKCKHFIVHDILGIKRYMKIRKMLGKQPLNPSVDNQLDRDRVESYLCRIQKQISDAKTKADIVLLMPHMGGQFNTNPGAFSQYVMQRLTELGADAVLASHPHILQPYTEINQIPCFYSIGNFSMSMSTDYLIKNNHPEYGLIVNLYVETKKIERITISFVKIVEDVNHYVTVKFASSLTENEFKNGKLGMIEEFNSVRRLLNLPCDDVQCFPLELEVYSARR